MTAILGVLNVTPDSFSDGGRWERLDDAVAHAQRMRDAGADWIDVGGESTRPGSVAVDPREEQDRVLPVVRALADADIPVSIDTRNAATARAAVEAGATMINDVSGGLYDPHMGPVAAETGVRFVVMHWRGGVDVAPEYIDVVSEVRSELKARLAELIVFGVKPEQLIIDPGLGFAKTAQHNWELLRGLDQLTQLAPVLIGASRKRFLGRLLPPNAPLGKRDAPTATISALAASAGAWGVRVHDVAATRLALDVWDHWKTGGAGDSD
ncbi:dihydropteroate synthase [Protaetiibacter sp. SSC-01]|uniref:dihydropteroate synthase n=1 Tax=Protaetiibacter sp. SSC-01 TaxID=2759943 RepID=UPI0016572153|nr:dihydropteroate synthase [Protaetiibacter sp. SSC-01]QNO37642.1 dihydropteroate synthase [Protaetiibacter sp. SSC-01]